MPTKDLFCNPFDEATITKLEIFEKYFETWLPVFIKKSFSKPIQVFDLFAGSGQDVNGEKGSPLRILSVISKFSKLIIENHKKVSLFLNDIDPSKYELLIKAVNEEIVRLDLTNCIDLFISNSDFKTCIERYTPKFKKGCNLLFIDQNGFGQVTESIFNSLISLDYTDFMFFISSTHIRRFANTQEFKDLHPKFNVEKIKNTPLKRIHNTICSEFQKYIPSHVDRFALYPFSLMKEDKNNIYGIIFVCKHPLAADNFLRVVWDKNKLNGTANYDIDEESTIDQGHLFDKPRKTKIEDFQFQLYAKIIAGEISDNFGAYYFALNEGHIPKHAAEIIAKMKKNKVIDYNKKGPLINYDKVVKFCQRLEYKVLGNEADKN